MPDKSQVGDAAGSAVEAKANAPEWLRLDQIELDPDNPRFGAQAGRFKDQVAVLDYLVDSLGVDSLLPSLAINGYFAAEPLVVKASPNSGMYRVVEGNRRLASCLILARDPRANNQARRAETTSKIAKVNWTPQTLVPVQYFSANDADKLLPYLGVRHIVSAQPWDSFAKARWVSDVVGKNLMTLDQIVEVIGDDNKTLVRMLEGYNFVNQLKQAGLFKPENSVRKGRGSNPEFPFSWLYTLLGYPSVRPYVGLADENSQSTSPIKSDHLPAAAEAVQFLFGDREKGWNSSISDSRKIGALAAALSVPTKRVLLKQGKTVEEIEQLSKPTEEQIAACLTIAKDQLGKALKIASEGNIEARQLAELEEQASAARRLASDVLKKLQSLRFADDDDA